MPSKVSGHSQGHVDDRYSPVCFIRLFDIAVAVLVVVLIGGCGGSATA